MSPEQFITLEPLGVAFLLIVGFIGGLVSGFIGSGGAFVLTPGMMSLGVPGVVAVASNLCHKFPKALVGAWKRHKYGQVDIKLGLVDGGDRIARHVVGRGHPAGHPRRYGEAGSNLYVSLAFVIVLTIVGLFVAARRAAPCRQPRGRRNFPPAKWVQSVEIPGRW